MFMKFLKRLKFPNDDERGIYAVFLIITIAVLLVAVGFAIDGPRLATANQKTQNIAAEAARYGASLILSAEPNEGETLLTLDERFTLAQQGTRAFISTHSTSTFNIVMTAFECDSFTGNIVVEVDSVIRNSLSGVFLGSLRRFNSEASAAVVFVPAGGAEVGTTEINVCLGSVT